MNKAKAMLDALMGPSRDTSSKSITDNDWKDRRVCRSFLVAVCPYDKAMLGGRKGIEVCSKIHNAALRQAFNDHVDGAPDSRFREKCEDDALQVLSDALTARDKWASEQVKLKNATLNIRTSGQDREVGKMKRQACEIKEKADAVDDTESVAAASLKAQLLKEYAEALEEYEAFKKKKEDEEKANALRARSCKICGTAYLNDEDYNLHVGWTRHATYAQIQEHFDTLQEKNKKRSEEKAAAKSLEKEQQGQDKEKVPPDKKKSRSRSRRKTTTSRNVQTASKEEKKDDGPRDRRRRDDAAPRDRRQRDDRDRRSRDRDDRDRRRGSRDRDRSRR